MKRIIIDREKCVGCGKCAADCLHHALAVKDKKAAFVADGCMECGHCVAICPMAAVSMDGYDMGEVKEYDAETFTLSSEAFLNHLHFRRTIRRFKPEPVEREKVEQILEAGRYTPTGRNRQGVRYVVVEHPESGLEQAAIEVFNRLKRLAGTAAPFSKKAADLKRYEVNEGFFFHHAPTVICVISEDTVDAALASANMETMAETLGLGVLYAGLFVRAARMSRSLRNKIGITGKETLVTAIALGYPAVKYKRTVPRKKLNAEWM